MTRVDKTTHSLKGLLLIGVVFVVFYLATSAAVLRGLFGERTKVHLSERAVMRERIVMIRNETDAVLKGLDLATVRMDRAYAELLRAQQALARGVPALNAL